MPLFFLPVHINKRTIYFNKRLQRIAPLVPRSTRIAHETIKLVQKHETFWLPHPAPVACHNATAQTPNVTMIGILGLLDVGYYAAVTFYLISRWRWDIKGSKVI